MKRTYYNTCQKCGANLDPGEKCDCDRVKLIKPKKEHDIRKKEGAA